MSADNLSKIASEAASDKASQATLSLRILGSGGPWVDAHRFGPSTLISFGSQRLLFDAGRGVGIRLVQAGEDPGMVNPIFITHHHLDHISDLADVLITSWMRGRKKDMIVYGPVGTRAIVETLMTRIYDKDIEWRSVGEPTWGGWKGVAAIDVEAGLVVDQGDWKVSCEHVVHGDDLPFSEEFRSRWKCLGYRFEAEGKVIAISGDTIDCDGVRQLAKDADVLLQCCLAGRSELAGNDHLTHVTKFSLADATQAATIAKECRVRHLVITHIRPKSQAHLDQLEREIRQVYDGKLTVGADLALVDLA